MSACGDCTVCCKTMGVIEISKDPGVQCEHCTGTACAIYDRRPPTCAGFKCVWLQEDNLPEEMRPDRSHVLMIPSDDADCVVMKVNAEHFGAHKAPIFKQFIRRLMLERAMVVFVVCGDHDDLREVYYSSETLKREGRSEYIDLIRKISAKMEESPDVPR